jgi:hypothetical protein
MTDTSLPDTFFEMAQQVIDRHPTLVHAWISGPSGKRTLTFPAASPEGFNVTIQCETYGLYPSAGSWHGAPWDVNTSGMTISEICEDCLGFVRSALCTDSSLEVWYSNKRPFRWVLSYPLEGRLVSDRVGLLVFNYLGRRSVRRFQNSHLPPRESVNAAAPAA